MTRTMGGGLAVALACIVVYANALSGAFHYDDFHSIVENKAIRSLANIPAFFTTPALFSADPDKAMYRPVLLVTYAVNYALGKDQASGFLAVNLLLHMACSLLVWRVGYLVLHDEHKALVAGLIFALHPLGSEPVNYISARSESLAAVCYLAAFAAYIHAVAAPRWRWVSWGAFGLGLLCKSIVITLVLNLWLYDRWKTGHNPTLKPYLPYGALALGYLALIVHNGFLSGSLAQPVRRWDIQFLTQLKAPIYYIKLLSFPWGLTVEPQFMEAASWINGAVLAALCLGVSFFWLGWRARAGLAGFALAWSLTVLLPTLIMPLNMLVNERRVYLVMAAFAWLTASLCSTRMRPGWAGILVVWAALTVSRNAVWSDEISLWLDARRKAPLMHRVHANLGKALQLDGQDEAALEAYRMAMQLAPQNGEAYNNIATLYHLKGQLDAAIHWYGQALERYPRHAGMRQNLADAYYGKGDYEQAIHWYGQALELDPEDGQIWNNYGQTLYAAGHLEQAEAAFLQAQQRLPEQPEIYNNLGNVYSRRQQYSQAIASYKKALGSQPEDAASIWANLADAHRQAGQLGLAGQAVSDGLQIYPNQPRLLLLAGRIARQADALEEANTWLSRAARFDAENPRVWVELAEIELLRRNEAAAQAHFERALMLAPQYSRAWYGLGRLKEAQGDAAGALEAYRRFNASWQKNDQRALEVRQKITALEAGG